jgi:hypothetical protein
MADILADVQSEPATPAAGQIVFWFDTGTQRIASKDANGRVTFYQPLLSAPPGMPWMDDVAVPNDEPIFSPGQRLSRQNMDTDAKGWAFLGTATGATTTVGPVIWSGIYRQLMIYYVIAGYNGGTPIGRLLTGAASISTTALTNGNGLIEDSGAKNATSISVPGCPLAVTASLIARSGVAFIDGASGSLKQYHIVGNEGNPAVGTSPTLFRGESFFSDLGTNLPLQRAQLTVYDTLIATAVSAQTFIAGTYLAVWGRNTD